MAKHSDTSWKQDHPSTLFSNSVQKADRMLKQAQSYPEASAVEQALNQISQAENALVNAEEYGEHMDTIEQNKEQLELIKQEIHKVKKTVEE